MSDAFVTLVAVQPVMTRPARMDWPGQPALDQQGGGAYKDALLPDGGKGTSDSAVVTYYPPLPPPTGLTATVAGSTITLAWDAQAGADHYTVFWTQDPTVDPRLWTRFDTASASPPAPAPTGAQLTQLAAGTYWFSIFGVNVESKNGQYADFVSATVLTGAPTAAPDAIVALPALGPNTGFFVWWSAVAGATAGYAVYVSGSSGQGRLGTRYASGQTFLGLSSLAGTFFVTACAVNSAGEGPLSREAAVTAFGPIALASLTNVSPRASIQLQATGGNGHNTYSFVANNSGGSLSSAGAYVAGATGSVTDTVQVADSAGRTATATIALGPAVSISGAATSPPRGAVALTASGGSGAGYAWTFQANNSGGSLGAGAYTAGSTPNVTDTILVTDSLGNTATKAIAVGAGVSISPAAPTILRNAAQTFTASGGSGVGYAWIVAVNNSGGSIGLSTGAYVAGATGDVTDTILVTDSLGNTATTTAAIIYPALAISPSSASVQAGQQQQFTASGGTGAGYTFSLQTNASGGSVTSGGLYTAGGTPGTDVVRAQDSGGHAATANATVAAVTIIPTDASEVLHVRVKNGALSDAVAGNAGRWFKMGAGPTMNAAATVFGKSAESMGPFTDANFFQYQRTGMRDDFSANTVANYTQSPAAQWTVDTTNKWLHNAAPVDQGGVGIADILPNVPAFQDGYVECVFTPRDLLDGGRIFVIQVRRNTAGGLNALQLNINLLSSGAGATLYEVVNNVYTGVGSYSFGSVTLGTSYRVRITLSARTAQLYWNGTLRFTATLTRTTSGVVLFENYKGNTPYNSGGLDISDLSIIPSNDLADAFFADSTSLFTAQTHVTGITTSSHQIRIATDTSSAWCFATRNDIPDSADISVTIDVGSTVQYDDEALIVRYDPVADTGLMLHRNFNTVDLFKRIAGVNTSLGSYSPGTGDCRTLMTLRLDVVGDKATVWSDYNTGALTQRFTATSLGVSAAGKVAFGGVAYGGANVKLIDNLAVSYAAPTVFDGDFIVTMILAGNTANGVLLSDGTFQSDGFYLQNSSGLYGIASNSGTNISANSGYVPSDATTPHILSFGRAGTSWFVKADGNPTVSAGSFTSQSSVASVPYIGRYSATGYAWGGKIYEIRATTSTPSAAVLDALHNPIVASALAIPQDAAEVSHVFVYGGSLQDLKGAWTKNGAPTFNAAASLGFPNGKTAESVGPFSDANYFSLGTGSDVLDFAGDFVLTLIIAGNHQLDVVFCDGSYAAKGYFVQYDNGPVDWKCSITDGTTTINAHTGHPPSDGTTPHVLSFARAGGSLLVKVDGNAVTTTSLGAQVAANTPATANRAYLGRYDQAIGYYWQGKFYEMRAAAKTVAAADLDALHTAIRGG